MAEPLITFGVALDATKMVQGATQARKVLSDITSGHKMGTLSAGEYAQTLRSLRSRMQELAQSGNLADKEVTELTATMKVLDAQLLRQSGISFRYASGVTRGAFALQGFAMAAGSGIGKVQALSAALLTMSVGNPHLMMAVAGLALITSGMELIGLGADKAKTGVDNLNTALENMSIGQLERAIRNIDSAMADLNTAEGMGLPGRIANRLLGLGWDDMPRREDITRAIEILAERRRLAFGALTSARGESGRRESPIGAMPALALQADVIDIYKQEYDWLGRNVTRMRETQEMLGDLYIALAPVSAEWDYQASVLRNLNPELDATVMLFSDVKNALGGGLGGKDAPDSPLARMTSEMEYLGEVSKTIAADIKSAFEFMVRSAIVGGQGIWKALHNALKAIAVESGVKAIFELAEGLAAAANPFKAASADKHFAAAAMYGKAAAAAGVGAAATSGMGGGGGAGAGGGAGSAGTTAGGGLAIIELGDRRYDPRDVDELAALLERVGNRRVVVRRV